jgi:hypothetical protein
MARFVNYQKRGVELPPGCKDLIDVLKGKRKAKKPGGLAGTWKPAPESDLFPSGGIGQIERYVTRILVSSAKFGTLTVSSLDGQVMLWLYRDSDESAFDVMLFAPRKEVKLARSIREFFGQRGIKHSVDHLLRGGLDPNYMRVMKYPLPSDAKRAAQTVADLLTEVYRLDPGAGLAFRYGEAVG